MRRFVVITAFALAACGAVATSDTVSPEAAQPQANALAPNDLSAFFDCLRTSRQTVVAAHRGGPEPGYAENAIETFAHTLSHAPALLEIDIARTRDGALVLMHDDTVERTTTGEGAVSELTLEQFRALSLEDEMGAALDAHPPTLRAALDWAAGRTVLELDVKRGVAYEDVIAVVREAGASARVIFITYTTGAAMRVHRLAPDLMISTSIASEADLDALERAGVDLTRILAWTGIEQPDAALNAALAQRGVEAMFGTLGGEESWDERFAHAGVDEYAALAVTGLQLISSDRTPAAARDLDAHDGVQGFGALQCVSVS